MLPVPYRARSESIGFHFIVDLGQAQKGLCQLLTVSAPAGGKSRGETIRYGVRFRVRVEATWAREFKGSRVGTGMARDTLHLEGLKVRVGEDGISEGRHLCKRHIVCS